jgi:hypothetical protein
VDPGTNYFPTSERKTMLGSRYQEMIANRKTRKEALTHMREAIVALSKSSYHMGKKKGYGSRKGIDEIFRTQEVFEDWCSKYHAMED